MRLELSRFYLLGGLTLSTGILLLNIALRRGQGHPWGAVWVINMLQEGATITLLGFLEHVIKIIGY